MAQQTPSEIRTTVERLTRNDKHSEALQILADALDRLDLSEQQLVTLRSQYDMTKRLQTERFAEVSKKVMARLEEPLRPAGIVSDLETYEAWLESLENIDAARPLGDARSALKRLRQISEIEWEYTRIANGVAQQLSVASDLGVKGVPLAKNALADLRTSTLADWKSRPAEDLVAAGLVPRLRKLVEETEKAMEALATRENLLTTQAGNVDFWSIEEEYQRWVSPVLPGELRVAAPTQMPKMRWVEACDEGGKPIKRYEASGDLLDLQAWYDSFLQDAEAIAKEKGERDLADAKSFANTEPQRAAEIVRTFLDGDKSQGILPYFRIPRTLEVEARAFLASGELGVAMERYERVRGLITRADHLRLSDPLAAIQALAQAANEEVKLPESVVPVRTGVCAKVAEAVNRLVIEGRARIESEPERAQELFDRLGEWLQSLPDPDLDARASERLDPDGLLPPVRQLAFDAQRYCRFAMSLATLERDSNQSGIIGVAEKLDVFRNEVTAAGLVPEDFRLYRQLAGWLQNESDTQRRVSDLLSDEQLFPADPALTNIARLRDELATARRGNHPALAHLIGALEARDTLHEDYAGSMELSLVARKDLLLLVVGEPCAQARDKALAQARLKEVESLLTATKAQRNSIAASAARADARTLKGFQAAWDQLQKALDGGELISEVSAAMVSLRDKLATQAKWLAERNSGPLQDRQTVEEIRGWIELAAEMGAGEAQSVLEERFRALIWQWDARRGSLESRLQALLRLSVQDPDMWRNELIGVAVQLAGQQIETMRQELERNPQAAVGSEPHLVSQHPELRPALESSASYVRKLVELSVWSRELANARYYSEHARKTGEIKTVPAGDFPSQADVDALLKLAQFRERIEVANEQARPPALDSAKGLRQSYDGLFLRRHRQKPRLAAEE